MLIIDLMDIERIKKRILHITLCPQFDKLNEVNQFLEGHNLPKLTLEYMVLIGFYQRN